MTPKFSDQGPRKNSNAYQDEIKQIVDSAMKSYKQKTGIDPSPERLPVMKKDKTQTP